MVNVLVFCECPEKNARAKTTKTGKPKNTSSCLDYDNNKYSAHFFSKHKDVLAAALEKITIYSDSPTIKLIPYKQKTAVDTIACFACHRLFSDTTVDEGRKGGYTRQGKISTNTAKYKWELHDERGKCTAEERLKALHTFMVYQSGSELLRSRLTEAQKVGLVAPTETRGRKRKEKDLVPTIIETIKFVEIPALDPPPPVEVSADLEKMKDLQRKVYLAEILQDAREVFDEATRSMGFKSSVSSVMRECREIEMNRRFELFAEYVRDKALEDTDQNRMALKNNKIGYIIYEDSEDEEDEDEDEDDE